MSLSEGATWGCSPPTTSPGGIPLVRYEGRGGGVTGVVHAWDSISDVCQKL